jgi:SAM-dependent methyltransferase
VSLTVSFYIYDRSGLYDLEWIEPNELKGTILNIHAGFDETSELLIGRFKNADFLMLDFYDPAIHTEVSIKRARLRYPPHDSTKQISTTSLPFEANSIDLIFIIFSAHEIRDEAERILFFQELERILKQGGKIYVTEHLRDLPNFLAYNIGFFHFYSKRMWQRVFKEAHLPLIKEIKFTPFISTFILEKHGTTL